MFRAIITFAAVSLAAGVSMRHDFSYLKYEGKEPRAPKNRRTFMRNKRQQQKKKKR